MAGGKWAYRAQKVLPGVGAAVVVLVGIVAFRKVTSSARDIEGWWFWIAAVVIVAMVVSAGIAVRINASPRWFIGCSLIAAGGVMMLTGRLGWQTIGYVLIVSAVMTGAASSFSVRFLRLLAIAIALLTLVLLVRVGGWEAPRVAVEQRCRQLITERGGDAERCGNLSRDDLAEQLACPEDRTDLDDDLRAICDDPEILQSKPPTALDHLDRALTLALQRIVGEHTSEVDKAETALVEAAGVAAERSSAVDVALRQQAVDPATLASVRRARWRRPTRGEAASAEVLTKAKEALATAQADLATALNRVAEPQDLRTLAQQGADEIVSQAFDGILGPLRVAELGDLGWILLAAAALVAYRRLEITSAAREIGPVAVEPFVLRPADATSGDDPASSGTSKYLAERMRDWLAGADVYEPSSVPGAAADQLTSVLADEAVPQPGRLAAIVWQAVRKIVIPPAGVTVSSTYEVQPDDLHVIHLTIKSARTGGGITSRRFGGGSSERSWTSPRSFVAEHVLRDARVVPSWAWWPGDGASMLRYQRVVRGEGDATALLERVVAANQGSGLLRVHLGNHYEIDGRELDALLQHSLATRFKRFYSARYRLAVSLSMLADQLDELWWPEACLPVRRSILEALEKVSDGASKADVKCLSQRSSGDDAPRAMLELACKQLKKAKAQMNIIRLMLAALTRPNERQFWWGQLRQRNGRRQIHAYLYTAIEVINVRLLFLGDGSKATKDALARHEADVEREVKGPVGTTALYNAACLHAVIAGLLERRDRRDGRPLTAEERSEIDRHRRRAVELLQSALTVPGSTGVAPAWLERDPDLSGLEGYGPFTHLVEHQTLGADVRGRKRRS